MITKYEKEEKDFLDKLSSTTYDIIVLPNKLKDQ
jgi:hypothetical protein